MEKSLMLEISELDVYYGQSRILRDMALSAKTGKITTVMGRNGVGKTTLLKAIIGLLPAKKGQVKLGDLDVTGLAPEYRARSGIAYVPQGREIFPKLSVLENLWMGMEARPGPKLSRLPVDEVYELFPFLAKMENRQGGNLSGGQQQQLAIARALLGKPKVLLLDEPTEGIQPSIIEDIGQVLSDLKLKGDLAIVLVEQYLDFAVRFADEYIIMDRGQVIAQGPMEELDEDAARKHLAF
jgi:urea transport system ATP-binding protein